MLADCSRWALGVVAGLPWTVPGSHGTFRFQGRDYGYLHHLYKQTWLTERAVEVPVVQSLVDAHAGKRVLEVGNVLSRYRPHQRHVIVDKYETRAGVLNRDVLELDDLGPFELVVAISTLEHVGWDELPREPGKAVEAVRALTGILAPGGTLAFTVPAGYNPALDGALRDGTIALSSSAALRRIGRTRFWEEVPADEVFSAPYDFLLFASRGVLFAFIEAPAG
ncbi:MAG TPA: hypothetical protein VMU39_27785 [Solirubrobacteraceae bacterium]|nr:hypothetical protein [Solirubrobacteraceae bacterium]